MRNVNFVIFDILLVAEQERPARVLKQLQPQCSVSRYQATSDVHTALSTINKATSTNREVSAQQ